MFETWFCFSPCKNNINDAVACFKKGLPSFGAAQAEHDFYQWTNKMLKIIGAEIEEKPSTLDWMPIPFPSAPKILFEPGFALTLQDLRERFTGNIRLSAETTIIMGAAAASRPFGNLTIHGTVRAHEPIDFFSHFSTETITWQPTNADDSEALRIRGYKVLRVDN
jgi:hypothetical protein